MDTQWLAYVDRLRQSADLSALTWCPDDPAVRAEVHRQLMMNLSLGYFVYFQSDPAHPDLMPFLNSVYLLQPNPDDTYFNCPIDGGGTYRLSGERGSVHLLTLTLGRNMMGMVDEPGEMLREIDADSIVAADGSIDLVLSAQRPTGHTGAWVELPPRADFLLIRQRSYRWGEERDARLAITRLDPVPLKPRLTPREVEQRMQRVIDFADRLSRQWLTYLNRLKEKPLNEIRMTQFAGGVQAQRYWEGNFTLAADEALVLETEVPQVSRYWNVQLNDTIWNTVEYVYRQSSLNGSQAQVDADGRFRAVIAQQDPGVPNWLDTGNHATGTIVGRWYECDRHPLPTLRKVKLVAVREHLPTTTPHISLQQRHQLILQRSAAAQMRRRW